MRQKIRVYVIARTKKAHHKRNEAVCSMLDDRFQVYKPYQELPQAADESHSQLGEDIANACMNQIKSANIAIAIPPYGNDCSWELGYCADKIPVVLVIEKDDHWREDWMSKAGSIAAIAVMNPQLEETVLNDKILSKKPYRIILNGAQLSDFLHDIAKSHLAGVLGKG